MIMTNKTMNSRYRSILLIVLLASCVAILNVSDIVEGRPLRSSSSASYSNDNRNGGPETDDGGREHKTSPRTIIGSGDSGSSTTAADKTTTDTNTDNDFWVMARQDPEGTILQIEQDKMSLEAQMERDEELLDMIEAFKETEDSQLLLDGMMMSYTSTYPSDGPSLVPSAGPSTSTVPSDMPSLVPTMGLSSSVPSDMPSLTPSEVPSDMPSLSPSSAPSASPSLTPSISVAPSGSPSVSSNPTGSPAPTISAAPTGVPSGTPSLSVIPSSFPSQSPSVSVQPSIQPSANPSSSPSESLSPSQSPTLDECQITPEQRESEIIQQLVSAGIDITRLQNLTTSQGQATDWIINQDLRGVCPDDDKLVQRWTVASMYFATGGQNWRKCSAVGSDPCGTEEPFINKRRFLSSFNECQWAGITCDIDACITEIEFENNTLAGTIPTEMALLTDLVIWGMEQGDLTSTIPTELGTMTNLVFIDFDFNELTGPLPTELQLLSGLRQLDLNDNQLTGRIDGLGNFLNMTFLQLFNNLFTGPIPNEIGALTDMTNFQYLGNQFTGEMPQEICDLTEANGGVLESMIADCNDDGFVCEVPTCCTGFLPGCPGTVEAGN
mmetsp:Transcript_44529/g.107865  ORF Transcript_44529/g.107865 Transcript_44529/m.107865 type:complete len:608 (+) Transcript_44529:2026-3849(+)